MAFHPQVESELGFLVDKEIKPLIDLLNRHHYFTLNSCQNHQNKWCFIAFKNVSLEKFKKNILNATIPENKLFQLYLQTHSIISPTWNDWRFPSKDIEYVTSQLRTFLEPSV